MIQAAQDEARKAQEAVEELERPRGRGEARADGLETRPGGLAGVNP